ncbi:MAG: hypothetical protein IJU05_07535 [Schwartzia sp.]|nr:hypothetical protein [Schwartzia sp. (in: firmicutes)]
MKKLFLAALMLMLVFGGTALATDGTYMDDKDVNEASGDDTMAYRIYIGKAVSEVDETFSGLPGWEKRPHDKAVRMYRRQGPDYIESVYIYGQPYNEEVVGSYRISFFTRTKEAADDIFFNTTKNFAYNLGRPSIKRGSVSEEWIVSDSFKISVELVEYDPRLPVSANYPFEISIRRTSGDYHKFFLPSQVTP